MSVAGGNARSEARVAILARQGKFLVAEPFFGPGSRMAVSRDKRYAVGDLVLLGASRGGNGRAGRAGGGSRPSIVRRLGRPDVARDVIEALMLDRGLRREFDPAVQRGAQEAAETDVSLDGRRDLRELATFTIDPVSAPDFDDALSAEAIAGDEWRVWVHIADVGAYVTPRSPVDREAYRRATSVYVPGAVEPMLPAALSSDACSLVPGAPRPTVTVEMTIGPRGARGASLYRSLIRSDARLDYDQVDRIFSGEEAAEEPWGEPLAAARAAAATLAGLRSTRSAVVIESEEPEFGFDDRGGVVSARPSVQSESHRLIEHLMIAANEQVAGFLADRRIPTLYRVHERPDAPAVERLVEQLASLGVPTPPVPAAGGAMTPQQAADVAGEASALVADWVARRAGRGARALSSLVLRSLKQAYYDDRNRGHAGLASPRYCHFTSPIRRYPDLICHRGVLSAIAGEPAPDGAWVHNAGPWTSTRERESMMIERSADDVARCFLLDRELAGAGGAAGAGGVARTAEERTFEGEVVGLIGAGAFVAFGERLQFEGMLPVRRLRGDWWELNEEGTILIGTRNGGALRLGDAVTVRVGRIDAPRGRVDLLPAPRADE